MATATESPAANATDASKMSKVQKLAALLVMIGPESAANVLKQLDDHELENVTGEMAKLSLIGQELQSEILREFSDVAVTASTSIMGGVDYTQGVLEKSIGLFKASDVIARIAPTRAPVSAVQQIVGLEARQIFNLLKNEQPQTIALIASYLSAEKSSQLLLLLRPDLREQVIERLATLSPTPIEVVEKIVQVISQRMGGNTTRALNQTGGLKSAADLLNALEKNVSKSLLISLEERNPELGQAIRQKMFTFDDVARLDTAALQKILREVDMRDLAIALKTASEAVKSALLGCISKRAAETVVEEISFLGPLKLRDIEAAQTRIIDATRRLEAEGEIELSETAPATQNEVMA
jgi:flagellar motor switch protein FliG